VIAELLVTDAEAYEQYHELAEASIAAAGGTYKVRGGKPEGVEGEPMTNFFVVLEFPDMDAARGWYDSEQYQDARWIRWTCAETKRFFFIEGYEPD
jgi:uncharacterized protein (DUF1330 family)